MRAIVRPVPLDDGRRLAWDAFCDAQPDAWVYHTTAWLDYAADSRFGVESTDLSWLLTDESEEILAIVPLVREEIDGVAQLTCSGEPTPAVVFSAALGAKRRRAAERIVFDEYARLANENGVARIVLREGNRLQRGTADDSLVLARHGYLDVSVPTAVVDLRGDDSELLSRMRNDHRNSVKRSLREGLEVVLHESGTDAATFARFRADYTRAAGRQTRPDNTFERLFEMLGRGLGILCESLDAGATTAWAYLLVYKDYAYYALACRNEGVGRAGSHILQWQAMRRLRDRGLRWYELGAQYFAPTVAHPVDAKALSISEFKRGFGDLFVTAPTGERFLSRDFLEATVRDRAGRYADLAGLRP